MIRHLSLYGWLRWIHSSRSDATLRVRTENGSGTIWCSAGTIIDAEWDGRVAEEALREILPRASGTVTIDFDPVEHPCRVVTPTPQLLHITDGEAPHAAEKVGREAAPPAPPQAGATRKDRFAELAQLLAESIAPVAGATSRPAPRARKWAPGRSGYIAGALVVAGLAALGFAIGRQRATNGLARSSVGVQAPPAASRPESLPPPAPTAGASELPIITPRARELLPIPFVSIEVEPAYAEIWLDRELAGRGALQLAAIHDGMLHELRFTAPQHETKTLFFRDAPPAGRVLLSHITEQKTAASNADVSPTSAAPRAPPDRVTAARAQSRSAEIEAPAKVARQRAAAAPAIASSSPPPRARAVPPPSSQAKPARERSPRVELIEVHAPRVQVLD